MQPRLEVGLHEVLPELVVACRGQRDGVFRARVGPVAVGLGGLEHCFEVRKFLLRREDRELLDRQWVQGRLHGT